MIQSIQDDHENSGIRGDGKRRLYGGSFTGLKYHTPPLEEIFDRSFHIENPIFDIRLLEGNDHIAIVCADKAIRWDYTGQTPNYIKQNNESGDFKRCSIDILTDNPDLNNRFEIIHKYRMILEDRCEMKIPISNEGKALCNPMPKYARQCILENQWNSLHGNT